MKHFNNIPIVTILLFSYILTLYSIKTHASALTSEHEIYKGFINPPQEAKPRVWWHWMDGNITEEGIYKDLLWMNRIGIGGFHQFDASLYTKPIVKERLVYMTPKWKKAFRYAIHLADSLNMEVGIASAPGWSSTGGPWVNPKNAMKKLVWRTFTVEGQKMFSGKLPSPYTTTGEFQNIPIRNMNNYTEYYEDIATIAVRLPSEELSLNELDAEITSSGGNFSLHKLTDGDFTNAELLPFNPFDKYGWIEYSFPKPQTIRALSFVSGRLRTEWRSESPQTVNFLQCSDNGVDYRMVCGIPDGGNAQQTISIPETTARYFRVLVPNPTNNAPGTQIPEFVLHPTVKINHTEENILLAQSAIREILTDNQPIPVTVERIISEVGRTFGVSAEDIRSSKRSSQISNARQIAMYVIREITQMSMAAIGNEFGGRDHSTVVYATGQVVKNMKQDTKYKETVEDIIKNIRDA